MICVHSIVHQNVYNNFKYLTSSFFFFNTNRAHSLLKKKFIFFRLHLCTNDNYFLFFFKNDLVTFCARKK